MGALVPLSKNPRARPKKNKNEEVAAAATMNSHKIKQSLASRTCQRWVGEALGPVSVVVREDAEVGSNGTFAPPPELTKFKRAGGGAAKGTRHNFKCMGRWLRVKNIS